MRIRCGWADGSTEVVYGDIEAVPNGLKFYGQHQRMLRSRVASRRCMVNADEYWAIADPQHGPARKEDGMWVRLNDEQVLRLLLWDLSQSWFNWAHEVPS